MGVHLLLAICFTLSAADFEVKDQAEFNKIFPKDAKVVQIATGMQFTEGPVWIKQGGYLIFSDIPPEELKRWDMKGGLQTFRKPSGGSNGNTVDLEGRLITAEHGNRRVSLTGKDGKPVTLVDSFEGKKFNSPNDVVVKSDGTVWFTDPDYGLAGRPRELPGNYVFRYEPKSKALSAVVKDFDKPNGLCFAPDESKLYIADSGKPRHIRVFNVAPDGSVSGSAVFATIDKGGPDGIRCDDAGRVWSSSGDGAQIFSPSGALIARILLPEAAANLGFGGKDGHTLFLTARKSLYSVETKVKDGVKRK